MCHRSGMRGEALGSAQADGELDHLKSIEHGEGFRLAALDFETEGRTRSFALALENRPVRMIRRKRTQVPDRCDLGMPGQEIRYRARAFGRSSHSEFQRLER